MAHVSRMDNVFTNDSHPIGSEPPVMASPTGLMEGRMTVASRRESPGFSTDFSAYRNAW